jgi:hypothetical protein
MSTNAVPPGLNTSGNILPATFCKLLATTPKTIAQCVANDPVYCVSQLGTHDAPGLAGSTGFAANAGLNQPIQIFIIGDVCPLASNPAGVGWTQGDFLRSDALGYGATGSPGTDNIGARALETVTPGQVGLVHLIPSTDSLAPAYQVTTATTAQTINLSAAQAGTVQAANVTTSGFATYNLPPVATVVPGDRFVIVNQANPAATGTTVMVNPADVATVTMYGNGFAANQHGAVDTIGTARPGDSITVVYDGANWEVVSVLGTWAAHA